MSYRKKLIEVALPLEAINEASAREKSIRHGHPSTLHLWWARRPLAAARAVIFTSLVDDPDDPDALPAFVEACKQLPKGKNVEANGDTPRMRLFDFIERLVTWEATTDEAILNTARELIQIATEGSPPPLLDPFAGGGSIPLEAQRLGLEAHASDLNPVAVMINKAQIEIPPRFANMPPVNPRDRQRMNSGEGWKGAAGLAADVRYYGEWMREKAWEKIGHLYPTHNGETVIAWLWARTVKSPNPALNVYVPLVRSFDLSRKKGQFAWIEPHYDSATNTISYSVNTGKGKSPAGTITRGNGRCVVSGVPIPGSYIQAESMAGRMGVQLMAICTQSSGGRKFYDPTQADTEIALSAQVQWSPNQPMNSEASDLVSGRGYGFFTWADLFSKRQLATLTTLADLVSEVESEIARDALAAHIGDDNVIRTYSHAIRVYLAMCVSKATVANNTFARWRAGETKTAPAFGRQALAMVWDFAETNPFAGAGGDFQGIVEGISRTIATLPANSASGHSQQKNAMKYSYEGGKKRVISTDPPYYDNINYADLSDFSYVWLRPMLREIYPDLFSTLLVPKEEELVAIAYRFNGDRNAANHHFESGLEATFSGLCQFVDQMAPFTVYYAFKQSELDTDDDSDSSEEIVASTGWETMLEALVKSGFLIDGTWPMRTEGKSRLIASGTNALASSIVLVCRPRPQDAPSTSRRAFLDDLRRELPAALKEMQSGNIAPVDLAQASIGPGMAIYSRHSKVLEADGSPMSVRTALGLINAALDEYLAEQDGNIDPDTRFAVDWFTQFGFNEGDFGQADVLARAKNTSVAGVESAGLVLSGRGKVKLKHWSEYDPGAWDPAQDKRPTVWEATHHLIERLNSHGETGSALLMQKMPSDMAAEARQLAYRLYSICERKGWAEHARDYNALVISWSGIGEEAARLRDAVARGDATTQMSMFGDDE